MSVTDSQFAAFVDRVIACREAEDRAKEDTKQVYAEIAEAGEDKAVIGIIVREERMNAKDKAKADFREAAVDDARERYRRGKASHVRVREANSSSTAGDASFLAGGAATPSAGMGGEADRQLISSPVNDSGQGEADGAFRPGNHISVSSAPISEPVSAPSTADADDRGGHVSSHAAAPVVPSNVTVPRPEGCQRPDRCGSSSWRRLCHSCQRAWDAEHGHTSGDAA